MPLPVHMLLPQASRIGFDPRSIAGLEMWLDASDATTVTLNSGNVSAWRSRVGGRVFSQATAANQPIYALGFRSGRNALQFDAARRIASTQAASAWRFLHAEKTVSFLVYQVNSGGNTLRMLGATFPQYTTSARGVNYCADQRTATPDGVFSEHPANVQVGTDVYGWSVGLSGQTAGTMRVNKFVSDPAASGTGTEASAARMQISDQTGAVGTPGNATAAAATASDPQSALVIGAQNATGSLRFPFNGYIAEWLIWRGEFCRLAAEQSAVMQYLRAKWAS